MERDEREVNRTAERSREGRSTLTAEERARRTSSRRSRNARSAKKHTRKTISLTPANLKIIGIAAAALLLLILLIVGIRSCGSTYRTPQNVVKALVKAEVDGKAKTAKKCYGVSGDAPTDLQAQIDATIEYYAAHNTKDLKVESCDTLYDNGNEAYVYITYDLVLDNDQEYPCVATFMTQQEEEKYHVLSPGKITEEMSTRAAEAYAKFMTTDVYKAYEKTYDTFIKKNPGYEDKIIGKLA